MVSDSKDLVEAAPQQFKVEKGSEEGSLVFTSVYCQKIVGNKETGHLNCMIDFKINYHDMFVVPVSEQKETEVDPNGGLDAELEKGYPCPDALEFARQIMHRPVIIMGW